MSTPSVGSVALDLVAGNTSGFFNSVQSAGNTAAKSIKGTFTNAFSLVGKLAATALGTKAIVNFSKKCIDAASDLAEVQNVVDVTFGKSAAAIDSFAQKAPKAFGLSVLAAKQYNGTMGAMLKSMKLTDDSVLNMSTNLSALAGDMASFYNLSTDTAFEKIRSGISGETEPLKQLGINLSVANLEAYRMSQGISTAYNKMSQADQAILRYNYLLSVTADAQGDFARTSTGWANQTRILALNIETLKSSLGGLAIQALTPVLVRLNQIIEYATAAANALVKLLGGTVKTSAAASGGMGGLSSSAVQAANDITDTQKTAQKAAKKIKTSFADIDEIHILGNKDDDAASIAGAGAGTGGGGVQSLVPDIAYSKGKALNPADDINKLKKIGSITGVALMGLGVVLTLLGHPAIGIGMIAAGTAIAAVSITGGSELDNSVKSRLSVISTIVGGASLALGAILCFTGASVPVGIALLATGATMLTSAVAANWNGISDKTQGTIKKITSVVGGAMLALGAILCFSGGATPLGIALMAGGAASLASSQALNWTEAETKTGNTLKKIGAIASGGLLALGAIFTATGNLPLGLGLMAVGGASLAGLSTINWDMLGAQIKSTWDKITTWFNGSVKPVFTLDWWKKKFNVISDALSSVSSAIKKPLNALLGSIETMVNGAIRGVNQVINALNRVHFTVPNWVRPYGGKSFGFSLNTINTVSLPRLAQGGWVEANNPRLAIVGDNKKEGEIISPESKIREQVELALKNAGGAVKDLQELYSLIKSAFKDAITEVQFAFGGDWHIVIVDERGDVTAETIISAAERKNRRDGRTVIKIGG